MNNYADIYFEIREKDGKVLDWHHTTATLHQKLGVKYVLYTPKKAA